MSKLEEVGINWVIIGQQTPVKEATIPKIEWIWDIIDACDEAKVPVFLKNNLNPLFNEYNPSRNNLRQEFPICK